MFSGRLLRRSTVVLAPRVQRMRFVDVSGAGAPGSAAAAAADTAPTTTATAIPPLTYSPAPPEDPGATLRTTLSGPGSVVHASFPPGASVLITRGSVMGRSTTVDQRMALDGGPSRMLRRALAGGPLVLERLHASGASGDALIAPRGLSQVVVATLDGSADLYMRGSAFVACTHTVKLRTRLQKLSEAGVTGLFLLRAKGIGSVALSGPGAIAVITLRPGEEYVVSARHAIAWDGTVRTVPITAPAGWFSRLFLGSVVQWRVTGPGRVFLRTRADRTSLRLMRDAREPKMASNEPMLVEPGTELPIAPRPVGVGPTNDSKPTAPAAGAAPATGAKSP